MVLGFTDAFYHIPLRHSSRPYVCASCRGKWIVVAQGIKTALLIWGRFAVMVMRTTASSTILRARCGGEQRAQRGAAVILLLRALG